MESPLDADEALRQEVLDDLRLLDTAPDPVLDGLVRSAAMVLGTPVALVSLVDRDRQWFKARVGLELVETPRDIAFCAHAILGDGIMEVEDAAADPRFSDNPLVTGPPHIRFYAGAPIAVAGRNVGTLCVIGPQRRRLTTEQRGLLRDLGRAVEHWVEGERRGRALERAQRYNRELFEQLGHAVLLCDMRHAILDANLAAVELFGYPRGTLLQLSIMEVIGAREQEWLRSRDEAAVAGFRKHLAEWSCVSRDGRRFEAEMHFHRIDDDRYTVSISDIEERSRRAQQLRQLALAVEQSTESIVCTDLSSRILYINPATTAMSGYASDELIGQSARILGSGGTQPAVFAALYERLARGEVWAGLMNNRRKDGTEYIQSATITPLRASDGTIVQYVAVMKDVTRERRLDEELVRHRDHLEELVGRRTEELARAAEVADRANQAKSAFLATMSHEIRTPMNGVIGILDVLRRSPLTPYQVDLVETMAESGTALLGIIDAILDFSKIEAGRLTIEREPLELGTLVENVCFALKPLARAGDVSLHVFVDPALPEWISSDPVRLRQILNNLVGNAIKFSSGTHRRGRVDVRAVRDENDALVLTVTDNGVGIDQAALGRIFEPFVQAEDSTTRRFGGTGLGLSISKRLCDLLGGTIVVESSPGRGARFTVVLPIEQHPGLRPPRATRPLAGVHCKIVTSDTEARADWAIYLAAAGAQVETFAQFDALRVSLLEEPRFTCVVVVDARDDERSQADLDALRASFNLLPVLITHGQSREPATDRSGLIRLENRLVFRQSLVKSVVMVTGFESAGWAEAPVAGIPIVQQASPAEAERDGRLILVAEDNQINQKVIRTQLELLGFSAEVFDDGTQALAAWRSGRFGIVLTDLHMPTMDGYELARRIRAAERPPARIPIIALTANTLRGEAARCHDAGIDECLTKPILLDALRRVLEEGLPAARALSVPDRPGEVDAPLPILDRSALEELLGNDVVEIAEFLHEFRASMDAAAAEIEALFAAGDGDAVGGVAHRLKSSARAVGALALGHSCDLLETAALEARGPLPDALIDDFRAAVAAASAEFAAPRGPSGREPMVASSPIAQATAVVLLDDDPVDLERLTTRLAEFGIEPAQSWTRGVTALEWLRRRDTKSLLLLLDLQMPGMDGIDFIRRLAEQGYHGALAIVSAADPRVLETAVKLGEAQRLTVLGHIRKPIDGVHLQELLARWQNYVPTTLRTASREYATNEVMRGIVANEMVLYYQPKVSLLDGSVKGAEALVRWRHPLDGLVPPAAFIHTVEAQGGIDLLTDVVVSMAMSQARQWNDAGTPLCIAINVSMANLLRIDFPELLFAEAERHGVPFDDIRLEVTETRLMSDWHAQIGTLARLKLHGTGLSIDDFGTGHSSLAQLRDIPFDELKIDQTFVHGAATDATRRAILVASRSMAHDLGMTSVAEGVEDRTDWDFARASGVDLAQGFFIARPMPADDISGWMAEWAVRSREFV